jgi:hypothetical protein
LRLWEVASETVALELTCPFDYGTSVEFAADGKTMYSAGGTTSAYIWGLEPASWRKAAPDSLDDKGLSQAWETLANRDAAASYEAVWHMAATGNSAVHFLRKQLKPVAPFLEKAIAKLLDDLDSGTFKVREAAMAELRKLGPSVEVELRRAALKPSSLEAGRRLQTLLAELDEPMVATAALRQLRAVEVLERLATPEARQWLKELAGGVPEARLTREAQQILGRLDRKPSTN